MSWMGDMRVTRAFAEQGRLVALTLPDIASRLLGEPSAHFLDSCCIDTIRTWQSRTSLPHHQTFLYIPDVHICGYA